MPRAGLTHAKVVQVAADLADEVGFERITLSAVATIVGVRQPSLYKHVESLDALRRAIATASGHELAAIFRTAAAERSGASALRAMASACRDWAREHPGRYAASQSTPRSDDVEHDAAAMAVIQPIADALAPDGFTGDDAVDAIRAFRSLLHGFITLEAAGSFRFSADTDRSFQRLVAGYLHGLQSDSTRTFPPTGRARN